MGDKKKEGSVVFLLKKLTSICVFFFYGKVCRFGFL